MTEKPESINNTVPPETLKNGLFFAGKQWPETLTAKQIEDIMDFLETVNWKVVYG